MTSVLVLVVDDAPADREPLAAILRGAGHEVIEADNGEQALRLAHELRPTLIAADILMPTMDGYELMRGLRGHETTAHIPVIFYAAGYVIEEVRRLAAECGVSHVLVKPSAPDEVLRVIEEAIAARPDPVAPVPSEEFHRQHLRLVNAKLLEKVDELRETVILAGTLERESYDLGRNASSGPELESVLSRRELQVLRLISEGATNSEIAERLVIATSTVQSHVKRILHKLGVKNRTEAAVRYLRR
ncbi:MAG: two-component system, cell cycle sensor histidine kinase and response regulator CckA [Solirubrobacteraceae bacterium]|jgi:DNA-binding NarL/FixJ family response regulator|nr:two-component system, cell cycle sensor histidine kinase and response regulator CckA [Solirubrobacteraceae bacterium]